MENWDCPAAPGPHRYWQGAAVALILAMHGLGLYFLLLPARQLKQVTEIAFMTLMPPRPLPRTPPMPLPMPMPPISTRAGVKPPAWTAPPTLPASAITLPGLPPTVVESGPAIEPEQTSPTADLRTRARLAAGAADKALRAELKQDKPWLATPEPAQSARQALFEKLVAAAYQGGPVIKMEEYLTPDGRPATRVVTGAGSKCYAMPANPGSGADPFNTGGKLKQVPC